jgi:hypothetical protein
VVSPLPANVVTDALPAVASACWSPKPIHIGERSGISSA